MKIIIIGGAGFLGQQLARRLLNTHEDANIVLADRIASDAFAGNPRVNSVACDITAPDELKQIVSGDTVAIYHLAAIVSGQAEAEFDLGMNVNLHGTLNLLESARRLPSPPKFLFTSSLAVFGGKLPAIVDDQTAVRPQSSYGAQKAIGELLVNDYNRKGFIDGRVLRLPTISVRPGKPNRAASSFMSGIIREPLNGETAVCPVARDVRVWLSSPVTAIENLVHALDVPAQALGDDRTINLPGLSVTVGEMIDALERVAGPEVAARIRYEGDATVQRIVTSWPGRFDTKRAIALGFQVDPDFRYIVQIYQRQAFGAAS